MNSRNIESSPASGETANTELSFSADQILHHLSYAQQSTHLVFPDKKNPEQVKNCQIFLLTEQERVKKLGCAIDLGSFGNKKDGVDGKRGPRTQASRKAYIQRISDPAYPERYQFVQQRLHAKKMRETKNTDKKAAHQKNRYHQQQHLEDMKKTATEKGINDAKEKLSAMKVMINHPDIPTKQINEKIQALEQTIDNLETQQLDDESKKVADLFFVITLDNKEVYYDANGQIVYEQQAKAKRLHDAAQAAEKELRGLHASIDSIYEEMYMQKTKEIKTSQSYQDAIKRYQELGLSKEDATKLADQQMGTIVQTLTVREITQKAENNSLGIDDELTQKILSNSAVKAFTKVYEEIILVVDDLTDRNHLDRDLPVPYDKYFDIVTTYYLNDQGTLESYLFDTPSRDPETIYSRHKRTEKEHHHLLTHLFNKKASDETKEHPTDEEKQQDNQHLEDLSHEMNIFSTKRIRQLVMYHKFAYLRELLSEQGTGISLQRSMDFDYSHININEQHTLTLPITYEGISTTIRIDQEGTVRMEGLEEKMRSGGMSDIELSSGIGNITEKLTEAARLDPDQLMQCTSRAEIYETITNKISSTLLTQQSFSQLNTLTIAQKIEHESLLGDLRGYLDNKHMPRNPAQISLPPQIRNTKQQFTSFITHITKGGESKRQLNIKETRKISGYLRDPAMKTLLGPLSSKPYLVEEFLGYCGVYSISPDQRPTKLIRIFDALSQMATSELPPREENGYSELHKLIGKDIPESGTMLADSPYQYTGKTIVDTRHLPSKNSPII